MSTPSLGRARYFPLFIDDNSRYTTVYTIKNKSEVMDWFRQFKLEMENQLNTKIKRFSSNGGGEYTSKEFNQLLKYSGIGWEQTAPYTSEQNGVAARANRTIVQRAKAMLLAAGLSDFLLGEGFYTTVYMKNWSPTSALGSGMTPLQLFSEGNPQPSSLILFWAKGFKHVPKELRTKWEPHSIPCTFTDYAETKQFCVLIGKRIHITRDPR